MKQELPDKDWKNLYGKKIPNMNTKQISTKDHSTLAGLRSRLDTIIESAEEARAFLDNQNKWRVVASLIEDIRCESETAEQQINELL
jgi:hypothetical protein